MIKNLKITVVVDNTASRTCLAEHGLAYYVEIDGKRLFFDSGQGKIIRNNCDKLDIDPLRANAFVLSHGHYDHTGGIKYLSEHFSDNVKVYLHPAALDKKYAKDEKKYRYIGIAKKNKEWIKNKDRQRLFLTEKPTKIFKDVWVTGPVPRINKIEKVEERFCLNKDKNQHDDLIDDQSMFFYSNSGIVVLLGCCHSGIGNTLDYISKLTGESKIYAVIGGMHLINASHERLDFSAKILKKYKVKLFAPCHCTGQKSAAYLFSKNQKNFNECYAGKTFVI
ncbi:MBL fold metallo-hydrolase [bacterium]|nr:MBL fold metallo-hydrolase [bacterium]